MSTFAEVLARNRWRKAIYLLGSWRSLIALVLMMEVTGIAVGCWLMKTNEPGSVLMADYEAVAKNQEIVRTELDRLRTAREEDLHVREAMAVLMAALPEQVKLKDITIGDFHNGDWIVLEAVSKDRGAIESYMSTLRKNPGFEEMRIEDTNAGVRITVPLPEGFIWR